MQAPETDPLRKIDRSSLMIIFFECGTADAALAFGITNKYNKTLTIGNIRTCIDNRLLFAITPDVIIGLPSYSDAINSVGRLLCVVVCTGPAKFTLDNEVFARKALEELTSFSC